jgi:phosphate transport system ATP-binding protein
MTVEVLEVPSTPAHNGAAGELRAQGIHAWFDGKLVVQDVSLTFHRSQVTALIGPSGCGKSTFLRILNRMHETLPGAQLAGTVALDGTDIYGPGQRAMAVRRRVGMVFQRPNPFPFDSIRDNVLSGLKLAGLPVKHPDDVVEEALSRAGLWTEVRDRLGQLAGRLSGGQQQRLCIARALAVKPAALLMDEPCSALDPASTARVEQTMREIVDEVTVVVVTHNMQQARRVSDQCAFMLAAEGQPGRLIESGPPAQIFEAPHDPRTADYVNGRFG